MLAPEFCFEHDIDLVRRATQERKIDYPVAVDNDYEVWSAFRQPLLAGALPRRRGRGQCCHPEHETFLEPGGEAYAFTFG